MQLSALLSLSTPTHFINNGNRYNNNEPGDKDTYHPHGTLVGCVGARFERKGLMEDQLMRISIKCTEDNGYGINANNAKSEYLKVWAKFYGIDYFPTFDEASNNSDK